MTSNSNPWLIYGANGYTGKLIAQRSVADGHQPILAGRDEARIKAIAQELGCPYRVFSLSDPKTTAQQLTDVALVLNCSGPFIETAQPMIEACMRARSHYLDITGEWEVIERSARQNDLAQAADVVIMPAVGFDVVPSDCLAVQLATVLPTASHLELAFQVKGSKSTISPGTATTVFSQLGQGTFARVNGQIQKLPKPLSTKSVPFSGGERTAVAISWGDIASAFYSTGIQNIRVYQAISPQHLRKLQRWNWLLPFASLTPIQWLGRRWIKRNIPGPSQSERAKGQVEFWGKVTDAEGRSVEATLLTPEGYTLTSSTAVEIVQRVLAGEVAPGFSTPAKAFGGKFIEQFEGVVLSCPSPMHE